MAVRKVLRPVRPNKGLERKYQRELEKLVDDMTRSVLYWLRAEYKKQQPQIAKDALPSRVLADKIKLLMGRWRYEFNTNAERLASSFLGKCRNDVNSSINSALKGVGITVRQRMTRSEQDIMRSLIIANVDLIKSIPARYFEEIQGIVQRAIQSGRDVDFVTDELHKRYQVTRRRARFIARDQINKATEQMSMAKHIALGMDKAIWKHTPIGKTYRHSHVKFNGQEFKLTEGLYDSEVGHNVYPGELPGCHCIYQVILPTLGGENE